MKMPNVEVGKDLVYGYKAARDAAWGAAWGAAWDAVWGAARGAARGAAWGAARDAAWDAAWDAARDAAVLNTGLKDSASLRFLALEMEMLRALENGLGWYFPMKNKLILIPIPKIAVDERKRLHSLEKPAVSWRGGAKFHFIHGVKFDKILWEKVRRNRLSVEEMLGLKNTEQRMAVLKVKGPDALLAEANAVMVNQTPSKKYQLYLIENVFSQPAYFLKYVCPSTGRVYVSGVEPEVGKLKDAGKAIAWKWGLEKEEYGQIIEAS